MIEQEINQLIDICEGVHKHTNNGISWVASNVPIENQKAVVYNMKKFRRAINRHRVALNKRPVVAIFGESQVGKSYLVSNLAVPPEQSHLNIIDPSDQSQIDFIKNMNPKGGGAEATGLVSRFTITSDYKEGQAPFLLKLLSQSDIVKIIANGYLSDIMLYNYKVDIEEIQRQFQDSRKKMYTSEQIGFTEDDVYEVKEYLNTQFKDHFIIKDLNNINFWDDLAAIVPFLNSDHRWEVFKFLWGKHDFFNEFFNVMSKGLKDLNFAHEVRCSKDALTPQENTILDVTRLKELYSEDKMLYTDIYDATGAPHKISKSVLSAITAEVILQLPSDTVDNPERAFLKEADILDFPGARSRKKIPEVTFEENEKRDKLEVYLRGKISFLFDRYTYESEISTLLYCMHEKQSEVQDIPRLIYEWIKSMHGGSVDEREESEKKNKKLVTDTDISRIIPLLVIMTKFNIELVGSTSDVLGDPASHNEKWTARIEKNFNEFMSMNVDDKWPNEWSFEEREFKNIFFLRDPKYSKSIYKGLNENNEGVEKEVNEDYVQRLKDMENSFLNHFAVKKHIRDPKRAWNEVTLPGKSGIDYAVEHLNPTANPVIRLERLKAFINRTIDNLYKELEQYYEGDDLAEKLKKANLNGANVFLFMNKWNTDTSGFGYFIDRLCLNEDEAWKVYWDLQNSSVISTQQNQSDGDHNNEEMLVGLKDTFSTFGIDFAENRSIDENIEALKNFLQVSQEELIEMLKTNGIDLEKLLDEQSEAPVKSKAEIFAERLIANWVRKVNELIGDETLISKGLTKNVLELIVRELIKSKDRVKLRELIVKSTENEINNFAFSNNFDIVAHISSAIVNNFVISAGWKFIDESGKDYPKIKGEPVFSDKPVTNPAKSQLEMDLKYPGMRLFSQWIMGLKESFKANVLFLSKVKDTENAMANQELGDILGKLKKAKAAI